MPLRCLFIRVLIFMSYIEGGVNKRILLGYNLFLMPVWILRDCGALGIKSVVTNLQLVQLWT